MKFVQSIANICNERDAPECIALIKLFCTLNRSEIHIPTAQGFLGLLTGLLVSAGVHCQVIKSNTGPFGC